MPPGQSCEAPQAATEAELCAQWLAAISARDSTSLAFWQMLLSAAGLIGLLATLWFNRNALALSRAAMADARAAVNVAKEDLEVARDTARRQLRAYLAVKDVRIEDMSAGKNPKLTFDIINSGQTPARNVRIYIAAAICDDPNSTKFSYSHAANLHLGPDRHSSITQILDNTLDSKLIDRIKESKTYIILFGFIIYRDAFNVTHRIIFKTYANPKLFGGDSKNMSVMRNGYKAS